MNKACFVVLFKSRVQSGSQCLSASLLLGPEGLDAGEGQLGASWSISHSQEALKGILLSSGARVFTDFECKSMSHLATRGQLAPFNSVISQSTDPSSDDPSTRWAQTLNRAGVFSSKASTFSHYLSATSANTEQTVKTRQPMQM